MPKRAARTGNGGVVIPYNPDHKRRMPSRAAQPLKIDHDLPAVAVAR